MKKQSEKNETYFTINTHFSFFSVHYAINAPIKKYFPYPLPVDLSPPSPPPPPPKVSIFANLLSL